MISRRQFILLTAFSVAGCSKIRLFEPTPRISYPGMREGHFLRDQGRLPAPSYEITTDAVILGSGVAALTAAWKLAKEGFHEFILVHGPEFGGNAAGGAFGPLKYPCGAHYLPFASMESVHIREMLSDVGVILRNPFSKQPYYDEACIVHAPDERLYFQGKWQEGLIPSDGISAIEAEEHSRFFSYIESLKTVRGADGRKAFCVPVALSSNDKQWLQLDKMSVKQWLNANGYVSQTLHWYMNYICRDEYGAAYDKVSAWAGLHYFVSRAGQAENAEGGALLTWPDGLNPLIGKLVNQIDRDRPSRKPWQQTGYAVRLTENRSGVEVLCAEVNAGSMRTFVVKAKRALCAMPLMMAAKVVPQLKEYGFDSTVHMPNYAPWMVSNFLMKGFPAEQSGAPLSWDNVVYQGRGLGYVVSTHQQIRAAPPPKSVFSAYHALSDMSPVASRKWLMQATPEQLYVEAAQDLQKVYGYRLLKHVEALDITVRGHAMASPTCGFLSNSGLHALRSANGKVQFAHADLSGFSVFEEAAWWGYQAALKWLA